LTTIQQERTDIDLLIEELTRFRNEAKRKNNQVRIRPGMSYEFLTAYKQGQEFAAEIEANPSEAQRQYQATSRLSIADCGRQVGVPMTGLRNLSILSAPHSNSI
jgi:hypothetical protein